MGKKEYNKQKLKEDLLKIAPKILKYSKPIWKKIDDFKKLNKKYYLKVLKEFYLMLIMAPIRL